ncbi:uncharacterized protein LOC135374405 [Ornithodoros turicata]|uniref:uncharacterized protein LOC135374405 n=1 Tax=Ornithodoros turicata TaxID=34597 RepID=UPI003139124C
MEPEASREDCSDSAIDRLKKKRAVVRRAATKVMNELDVMLTTETTPVGAFEEKVEVLKFKEKELQKLDLEIESLISIDDLDDEVEGSATYQERIVVTRTRVDRRTATTGAMRQITVVPSSVAPSAPIGRTPATVKLPKLEIPKFNGDIRSWQSFWNQFVSTIDQNTGLSSIDKFKYLKSYITGKAASAIEGLQMTEENYPIATDILKERFGSNNLIIDDHMSRLLHIKRVHDVTNVQKLRAMFDELQTGVRSLEALGVSSKTYGVLLLSVLRRAVPSELNLEFIRKHSTTSENADGELELFIDFLKKEVETRERGQQHSPRPERRSGNRYPPPPSASVLASGAQPGRLDEHKGIFCSNEDHASADCNSSMPVSERKGLLKKENRCFRCTMRNHTSRFCRSMRWMKCSKCSGRHASSMCEARQKEDRDQSSAEATLQSSLKVKDHARCAPQRIILQTAQAWAEGERTRLLVRMMLDGGSQRTFIRRDISEKLRLRVLDEEDLSIFTFGDVTSKGHSKCKRVELWLRSQYDRRQIRVEALEVPHICSDLMQAPPDIINRHLRNKDMQIADTTPLGSRCENGIGFLIGCDYYWEVVTGNVRRLDDKLVAMETIFGWTLQEPAVSSTTSTAICSSIVGIMRVVVTENNEELSQRMRSFWELEHIGITDSKTELCDKGEVMQRLGESVKYENGRYEVSLPWKQNADKLADNKDMALSRLRSLTARLMKNQSLLQEYDTGIREYLKKGFAEVVTESETVTAPVFYMPHQAVIRNDRITTKLRIVFDASSRSEDQLSLNDTLSAGPNLNPDLTTLLLRFRLYNIAILADIEKAFLQVSLSTKDRNALRFIWYESLPQPGKELPKLVTWRMTRVPFGATSSPFLLAATIRYHLKRMMDQYPVTARILSENFYVDDLVTGADDVEEAKRTCREASEITTTAGMRLRKWTSNVKDVQEFMTEEAEGEIHAQTSSTPQQKVLGEAWKPGKDEFLFDMQSLLDFLHSRRDNKRFALQAVARIFDPFGFLTPMTTTVKILFQELWRLGIEWDERIPEDLYKGWDKWCNQLPDIRHVSVPRKFAEDVRLACVKKSLHTFCDASPKAYGAVIYLICSKPGEEPRCSLVISKARVAPLKKLSLPRLELMATLIGARLAHFVKEATDLQGIESYYWTDSTVALQWIKSSADKWKQFVSNRVIEVQQLSSPENWRHCPGRENPADLLTRGMLPSTLAGNRTWWNGPQWLCSPKHSWPTTNSTPVVREVEAEEKKASAALHITAGSELVPVLDINRYSSFLRMVRVTAWVKRFKNNAKRASQSQTGPLTAKEIDDAEKHWIKAVQREVFGEEINKLRASQPLDGKSAIRDFSPYLDDYNVLRVGGRLQFSESRESTKHPLFLPADHHFTSLLIEKEHLRLLHGGICDTLGQLRERFWIIRGRQAVKKIIKRCLACRKQACKPASAPVAPLPADRVTKCKPFDVTGVDFAGPLLYRERRRDQKCYIALFTCAVTRAVHLELVTSMSTDAFLWALRRFVSRRGTPTTLYSDNATTFKRAAKDLRLMVKMVKSETVQDYFANHKIQWKYIAERAAWWGGW